MIARLNHKNPEHARQETRAKLATYLEQTRLPTVHVPNQERSYDHSDSDSLHHALPEIFFQLSGINRFYCEEQMIDLKPSELCIIPAGVPHREVGIGDDFSAFVLVHDLNRVIVHAMECEHGMRPWGYPVFSFTIDRGKALASILSETANAYARKSTAAENLLRAYLSLILEIYDMPSKDRHFGFSPLISQCIDILFAEASSADLTLNSIAHRLDCNANSLSARFSKEVGKTAIDYLTELRIEQAKRLLKRTALNISEIANTCGYNDANYFSRIFKKQTGTTARDYRNAHP
ncbi:MAG: helix-turn-helix domain-containing protein [Opitutaceae bacterium]